VVADAEALAELVPLVVPVVELEPELELQAASSAAAASAVPGASHFFHMSVIAFTPAYPADWARPVV
jgi:alpha/beta superfamily hydrolase